MLKKKNMFFMLLLFSAACGLCGCSGSGSGTIKPNRPVTKPVISEPATPTPSDDQAGIIPDSEITGALVPQETQTPSPTPTNTPTPTPSPTPIPAVPAAPVAVNTDTTTIDFIINRDYPLTDSYKPDDLVVPDIPFSFNDKTLDKRKLKKIAAEALEELYTAALLEDGLTIYGVSGYRSYDRQYDIYGTNLINRGIRHTNLYSAAPGNSEHQTGLAIDVSCKSVNFALVEQFASTPEGIWLKENCWRFGFILRYPKEKEHITGYAYEPWHIRYVGVPLAYYLYTNDLTLEEYYGVPASQTLEELEDRPLIDTGTLRFYKLYASTQGSELIYKADGSVWISKSTGYPYLKELLRDGSGKTVKVNGTALFIEPAYDADGNYVLDSNGNILYTKPYFDADGNLWLDYNNSPVYLQPLWNANGTVATDADGNVLYTEPVKDLFGIELITETGSLTQKVPVRDSSGELTYNDDGTICFYEPYLDPLTGGYIIDTGTGLPMYPDGYYDVPHNTYPLPAGGNNGQTQPDTEPEGFPDSVPDEIPDETSDWNDWFEESDESFPDDPDTTTDETGGFLG